MEYVTKGTKLHRIIALLVAALFVWTSAAPASIVTASHLRTVSNSNKPVDSEQLRTKLLEKGQQNTKRDGGDLVVLEEHKGLLDYAVNRILHMALNNGTAHGNNYDEQGNLIKTSMNLKSTLAAREALRYLGDIEIVQHGITGTPFENLPVLRSVGMRAGHVGTNWQNLVWEALVEDAKTNPESARVVNEMIDWLIAKFGSKYDVASRETADPKKLEKLIGKELKNLLGTFRAKLDAVLDNVKRDIDEKTYDSAVKHMKGLGSDGSAAIVQAYLASGKAMPVQKSSLFKLGYEPQYSVRDNLAVETSAMAAGFLAIEGLRGKAFGVSDKKAISQIKDDADGRAKQIYEEIVNKDTILMVRVSEGFGRDDVAESFKANDIVVPEALVGEKAQITEAIEAGAVTYKANNGKTYKIENAIIDVIEGTNSFVTNVNNKALADLKDSESGATSVIVTGAGVQSLGNCPDMYTDAIFTTIPQKRRLEFVANPLDPEVTAQDANKMEAVLERIAKANGISVNDIEVVLMDRTREAARMVALDTLQKKYPGLTVVTIKDGTVAHSLVASFGRKAGKHKVVMTVGGSPEGFMNLAVAGLFAQEGAVAGVRVYSKEVNKNAEGKDATDLANRYAFTESEARDLRKLRPQDAEAILSGKKLFTQEDVIGDIEGSFAFITNNGVFKTAGVQMIDSGRKAEVNVLRVGKLNGRANVWMEQKLIQVGHDTVATLNPKPVFKYELADYASIPGWDLFQALKGTNKAIMCANIRSPLSLPGIIKAAIDTDSYVIFQQAKSELGYTWPSGKGHEAENAIAFAQMVKAAAKEFGFKNFAIKGDHITVQADAEFLKNKRAQGLVEAAFENILSQTDNAKREAAFKDVLRTYTQAAKDYAENKSELLSDAALIAPALKATNDALELVKTEVANDFTVFALDASFMPMRINTVISAFLAGFIPETAGLEVEVGEIGGKRNSTVAEAVELITGIKYREKVFVDSAGTMFSKLVRQGPTLSVVDALESAIDFQISEQQVKMHKEGAKAYPIVVSFESLVKNTPEGLIAFQEVMAKLGKGNIKVVLDVADGQSVEDALKKLNEINGDYTAVTRDMFADVVTGSAREVAAAVKAKFGVDKIHVIGTAEYADSFGADAVKVVLNQANKDQITLVAKALKLTLSLIENNDQLSKEELQQLDSLFAVDAKGDFSVAPLAVTSDVIAAVEQYANQVEEVRV